MILRPPFRCFLVVAALLLTTSAASDADEPTAPFRSELITEWGEAVTPDNAWTEYPRPQMKRPEWVNLNGLWDYAVSAADEATAPTEWDGRILVPFCLESKLGGIERLLQGDEALWYRTEFDARPAAGKRLLLHFEAVDYECEVRVNGAAVGSHRGGSTPFSFDVTDQLVEGANELVVRVEDDTAGYQLRGKQHREPHGCFYTRVSGIWQTVWLEETPACYVEDLKIATDAARGAIAVAADIANAVAGCRVTIRVLDGDRVVAEAEGPTAGVDLVIPDAKLWSLDSPHLYDLEVRLLDAQGEELDRVGSYAGIRSVGKSRDADGHLRLTLNGEPVFHHGVLDQGWWPDGLLTPPSDEAMLYDVEWLLSAGFNMIRKHIKVEPRRYYYHCDRLGVLVWQDQPNGGDNETWPEWTRLKPNPQRGEWPDEAHEQYLAEFEEMIDALENHPSIVMWVPFNERWGQHRSMDVGRWVAERDPSRLQNIASGGNFWPIGDVVDAHKYPHPEFPFRHGPDGRFDPFVKVMGEYGGHGYPVKGRLWDSSRRNWGYGGLPKTEAEYRERYVRSMEMLAELKAAGIAAGVYTQTSDVEGEINGLLTYDRRVAKIPAEELAEINARLYEDPPVEPATAAAPEVDPAAIRAGLESHDRALFIKSGWIRDPFITRGPDDYFYLTGTQANPGDARQSTDPYNTGLGPLSIVGEHVRVWRSRDLVEWESYGEPFTLADTHHESLSGRRFKQRLIWAPEVHWLGDRWALVHCPKNAASLALSAGPELGGPWEHPMGERLGKLHDPSLFRDDDGTLYVLWGNTKVAPLKDDLSGFAGDAVRIDPAGTRLGPGGKPIRRIGHEGATMIKVGGKYVHFGTAWSTDGMRRGSYNLYYCTADQITGPYGPRQFAGRFLGHGTPFQDREGRWWCTAFYNANVPPLPREGIRGRDLGADAQTINQQGVTIVPLDVSASDDGDVRIRAKDPDYARPGPDEAQAFAGLAR